MDMKSISKRGLIYFLPLLVLLGCKSKMQEPQLVALVKLDGKYGFVKTDGSWLLEPKYFAASDFSHGLACVIKEDYFSGNDKDYAFQFVDQNGDVQLEAEMRGPSSFYQERAMIQKTEGNFIINMQGDVLAGPFTKATSFSEGLARVEDPNGKVGFINTDGEWIIHLPENASFSNYGLFSCGLATFHCQEQGQRYTGYINTKGEVEIPCSIWKGSGFNEDMAFYKAKYLNYGYINKDGEPLDFGEFSQVFPFSEGIACVKKMRDFGFINKKGEVVIDFYDWVPSKSSEGLIALRSSMKGNTNYGYMDTTGVWVIPQKYTHAMPFAQGYGAVKMNSTYGFVNRKGEEVIAPRFTEAGSFHYTNRTLGVKYQ